MSLKNGVIPCALKVTVLKPLLKKQDADFEQLQNFRPISNLTFVSKLIVKAVALQLNDHILRHHLDETFQSAYKAFHSTETALVRVHNDILTAIDNNKTVILLLLDLSAAFDTVDHSILLSRLSSRFGIKGTVLAWLRSYLTSRKQYFFFLLCWIYVSRQANYLSLYRYSIGWSPKYPSEGWGNFP